MLEESPPLIGLDCCNLDQPCPSLGLRILCCEKGTPSILQERDSLPTRARHPHPKAMCIEGLWTCCLVQGLLSRGTAGAGRCRWRRGGEDFLPQPAEYPGPSRKLPQPRYSTSPAPLSLAAHQREEEGKVLVRVAAEAFRHSHGSLLVLLLLCGHFPSACNHTNGTN